MLVILVRFRNVVCNAVYSENTQKDQALFKNGNNVLIFSNMIVRECNRKEAFKKISNRSVKFLK